jgi:hypothetical protein
MLDQSTVSESVGAYMLSIQKWGNMKRRNFIKTASASALGLLAQAVGAQQKAAPPAAKAKPEVTLPRVNAPSQVQQFVSRFQQVSEGGS